MKAIYANAKFSDHWLDNFKKRLEMRKIRINGERASIPRNVEELMKPIV